MQTASIHIIWLLLALAFLNLLGAALVRSDDRFWHPPILIWLGLLFGLLLLQVDFGYSIDNQLVLAEKDRADRQPDGAVLARELQTDQEHAQLKRKVFRLLGAQSFFTLFLLTVGYQHTGSRRYRQAALSFALLSFLYLVLEVVLVWAGNEI